jgi:hypothetical protein
MNRKYLPLDLQGLTSATDILSPKLLKKFPRKVSDKLEGMNNNEITEVICCWPNSLGQALLFVANLLMLHYQNVLFMVTNFLLAFRINCTN